MPEVVFPDEEQFFLMLLNAGFYISQNPALIEMCQELLSRNSPLLSRSENTFSEYRSAFTSFLEERTSSRPVPSLSEDNCDRIYIDGCWDIMHSGHFNAIRQAKMLGRTLVVGIHSDEEIMRNKGMPVMNNEERVSMVRACKWVDEVVENAPYSASIEWLDSVNCRYIAHGDDIAINCEGLDAYGQLKSANRFKVIKRTEGISTTSIVGKLLLMTQESRTAIMEPFIATDVTSQPTFLATTRRI